jgi:hypothetical protein
MATLGEHRASLAAKLQELTAERAELLDILDQKFSLGIEAEGRHQTQGGHSSADSRHRGEHQRHPAVFGGSELCVAPGATGIGPN